MTRYFEYDEKLTFADFQSLRMELFEDLADYLHTKYNIFDRLDEIGERLDEYDQAGTIGRIEDAEARLDALDILTGDEE